MPTRFALLIGNNAYTDGPLTNPSADVDAMASALREYGFDVTEKFDQSASDMEASIVAFKDQLEQHGGLGILFFAGHGCELGNHIFLLPVDCPVSASVSALLTFAIPLTHIEKTFEESRSSLVVLIDACRDQLNTDGLLLPDEYKKQHKHTPPLDSIYVFSTASGNEASDGKAGAHSPFVTALLHAFKDYHHDVESLLKRAIEDSASRTSGRQRPRLEGALRKSIPLSTVARLRPKGKLTAYGVRELYGLAQHPSGTGVLGWTAADQIYHLVRQGADHWLALQADEIMCARSARDAVWIVFKSAGKTLLGQARSPAGSRPESVPSIEIGLQRAHAMSIDERHRRILIAGRNQDGGVLLVYYFEEKRLVSIPTEGCPELYVAEAIDQDRVLLGGPNDYLAVYSQASGTFVAFAEAESNETNWAHFYSIIVGPDAEFALAGGSSGGVHRLDLRGLVRHGPVFLPPQWQDNELFEALGEVADDDAILRFVEGADTLCADDRRFLEEKLPSNNILTLLEAQSEGLVIACSDAGRVYSLAARDLKILDFCTVADERSSGQAIIDKNGDVFVDTGKGEVRIYNLARQ